MRSKIDAYITQRLRDGKRAFVLRGGRRSGKTYAALRFLLTMCGAKERTVVNVASMTAEQGRLGAYADAKNIIAMSSPLFDDVEVLTSPREIRFANGSRMHFNQYSNAERAKGIACDWLFMNEANNFSKQHYTDLMANVRRGVFIDYNPNVLFWVDDYFTDDDICTTTWQDNPYLTAAQLEYFAELKRQAERDNATSMDIRNYNVYYLGRYAEAQGSIFNEDVICIEDRSPGGLNHYAIFCDPSALRGSDYFACVLSAMDDDGNIWVVDTYSVNMGTREGVVRRLVDWCRSFDVAKVYVETNGIIGIDFFEFAMNSGLDVAGWDSRGNKTERIIANYQNIKERVKVIDTAANREFLKQVFEFSEKMDRGSHDDNVDALNSSYNMQMATF